MPIEIRSVSGIDELERWVAVHNAIRPDDPESTDQKVLIRAEEIDHVDLLAYVDGEPVGTAMIAGDRESEGSGRPWVEVNVLPSHRGRGVGTALLRAASEHARRRGKLGFECEAFADDLHSIAFLERRGFVEHARFRQYGLDLSPGRALDPEVPSGLELAWLVERPSLVAGMYEVAAATYPELGGYIGRQAETLVEWQVYELGSSNAMLDLTPVMLCGAQVVGFSTARRLVDAGTAELRMVSVRSEWRRRGVARALVQAQLGAARDRGFRRLVVWLCEGGPAGLYRGLGFEPVAACIVFRGPLLQRGETHGSPTSRPE
jgi:GNAT superfamily N-acetyltransferase